MQKPNRIKELEKKYKQAKAYASWLEALLCGEKAKRSYRRLTETIKASNELPARRRGVWVDGDGLVELISEGEPQSTAPDLD